MSDIRPTRARFNSLSYYSVIVPALTTALIFWICSIVVGRHLLVLNGEDAPYWVLPKLLLDQGRFVVFDRAPISAFYLLPFHAIGLEWGVAAELLFRSFLISLGVVFFLSRWVSPWAAAVGAAAWLPFISDASPFVQGVGLSFVFFGVALRWSSRFSPTRASYFFLLAAALWRGTFGVLAIAFGVYDFWRLARNRGLGKALICAGRGALSPSIVGLLIVVGVIAARQWQHPWNNVFFAPTRWFPTSGKNLIDSYFIGVWNWLYIQDRDGNPYIGDFYFTNRTLFGGASTALGAILANPAFVFHRIISNLIAYLTIPLQFSLFTDLLLYVHDKMFIRIARIAAVTMAAVGLVWLFVRAIRLLKQSTHPAPATSANSIANLFHFFDKQTDILIFGAAALLTTLPVLLTFGTKARYLVGIAPLMLGAAVIISNLLPWRRKSLVAAILMIGLSPALSGWTAVFKYDGAKDRQMVSTLRQIERQALSCRRIMVLENTTLAAFTSIPIEKIHSVFEIPPFGQLGDAPYGNMKEFDCLLISDGLRGGRGWATNIYLRLTGYVAPREQQMLAQGGCSVTLPGFGSLVRQKCEPEPTGDTTR